jgi:hypothetical protein
VDSRRGTDEGSGLRGAIADTRIISTFVQPSTLTFSKMGKLIVPPLHLTSYIGVANPVDGYSDVPSNRVGPAPLHVSGEYRPWARQTEP